MARCWSCGGEVLGGLRHWVTCPTCSIVEEQKKIRERLESSGAQSLYSIVDVFGPNLDEISGILETGFGELSEQLANIASILEWGFEEIEWKLDQIKGTLKDIHKTLKTPSSTQADEWRQIGEELRRRGVLDESEKLFLKSLETNPLDYRAYIGLGKTCLQTGEIGKARSYWGKSLPHAPKGEIDYKSYSYRLIGRLDFCEGNIQQAVTTLQKAIELSSHYWLGYYDYAQYSVLVGDRKTGFSSLKTAVTGNPILFELAKKEQNLRVVREEIIEYINNSKDFQEEMKFREAWRGLGISHYCVDKMIAILKDLFRRDVKKEKRFSKSWLRLAKDPSDIRGIVEAARDLPRREGEIDQFDVEWALEEILEKEHNFDFELSRTFEFPETIEKVVSVIRDVSNFRLWPRLTIPIEGDWRSINFMDYSDKGVIKPARTYFVRLKR